LNETSKMRRKIPEDIWTQVDAFWTVAVLTWRMLSMTICSFI